MDNLLQFFVHNLVQPVSEAIRQQDTEIGESSELKIQNSILKLRDELIEEIEVTCAAESVMTSLLEKVEQEMLPKRKRAKRSLEDTVQMLSSNDVNDVKKSVTPPIFVMPTFPPPNNMMQRWPFANPIYMNALNMFQQSTTPKSSEEQLAALMKISMANFIKNVGPQPLPTTTLESDTESDIKVDVESDDGEVEVDIIESASSTSSGASMTSPTDSETFEKPFICMHNNCGKRFANKFLLKKHMFIHTGLRPHTCPHCHKKFNRKDNLLRHKKTHSPNAQSLGKVTFPMPQLPSLHNIANFNHFHALKMQMENASTPVRGLS